MRQLRNLALDAIATILLAIMIPLFVLPAIAWDGVKRFLCGGSPRR